MTPKPFTGGHMLALMIGFFGIVVGVNLTMAVLASKSWSGLVVKNSYVASQHYNDTLKAARRQKQIGWQSRLTASPQGLELRLSDRDGKPLAGAEITAVARHPLNERLDAHPGFQPQASGLYHSQTVLKPGIWNVEIAVKRFEAPVYRQVFRIVIKDGTSR